MALNDEEKAVSNFAADALRWKQPNLDGLTRLLANFKEIHLVAKRLDSLDGDS